MDKTPTANEPHQNENVPNQNQNVSNQNQNVPNQNENVTNQNDNVPNQIDNVPNQIDNVPNQNLNVANQNQNEASTTMGTINPDDRDNESYSSLDDIELDADLLETVLFYLGDFGIYQKLLFVAMIFPALFFSWVYFAPMFVVVTPRPFWCFIPELASLTKDKRKALSTPANNSDWDGCYVYDTDWKDVLSSQQAPPPTTVVKECTTGWEFSYEDIPYPNIVSERNWVCENSAIIPQAQTIFFVGSMVGGFLFGWIADSYGRVPAMMGVNIIGGIGGIGTIFTSGSWDFTICRFLSGMSFDGCILIAYILVLEFVGPGHRTFMATMPLVIYYGAGSVALPWMAYFISDWRIFLWVTSLPMFIVIIAPWTMPESVRWLVGKGRIDEAVKVLKKFERVNRARIPIRVMNAFIDSSKKMNENRTDVSIIVLFKNKLLRSTTIFMTVTYSICACVYDVIVRLSESFGLNFFVTFTINAAAEIPSVIMIVLLLDRLGRRNLTWGPLIIASICILVAMLVPKGFPRVVFACLARFCINLTFSVTVQWATEILPTPIRATASSALHISGFASSCLSPFIVYSERIQATLPFIIILVMVLVAAAVSLALPETKGLEMPQTVADTETIIIEYSLFKAPEVKAAKKAINKLLRTTFRDPIRRSKKGRVTEILSGHSKMTHSKLSGLDLPKLG